MKRLSKSIFNLFIFILILYVILPIVSAQSTVKVFNKEFQLIIFIPLVLITIAILFLIILYIVDYSKRLKEIKESLKIDNFFSLIFNVLRHKKDKEDKKDVFDLRKQLSILENKLSKIEPWEILKELTLLQKEFYKHNLNIKPNTSTTELKTILKKDHLDVIEFSEKLSELKYSGSKITKDNARELLSLFGSVIKKHSIGISIEKDEGEKSRRKLKKVSNKLFVNARENIKGIKNSFTALKNYFHRLTIKSKKQKILGIIKQGKDMLYSGSPSAKNMYIKALLSYYKLRLQEEKEIHSKLQDFHDELNVRGHVKEDLSELSRKIIHLKHTDNKEEGTHFFNQLKNYVKNQEDSNIKKLDQYSEALKKGEQKLTENIKELEEYALTKDKQPILQKLKKLEPKKEVFNIPKVKIVAPPKLETNKTKVKLSKHLSNLINEKNLLYNKLKSLESETLNYEKETNAYQKQFVQKYISKEAPKEIPRLVRKYDAHKNIHKLSQERELIERKLTELK